MWFSELVSSLVNVMPDVNRKELPAWLTMGKIYEMYIETTQSGPNKPLQRTQFRRTWKSCFPEVIIPKVRILQKY